jgi:soluble lytic murein transglycosylase-like protein
VEPVPVVLSRHPAWKGTLVLANLSANLLGSLPGRQTGSPLPRRRRTLPASAGVRRAAATATASLTAGGMLLVGLPVALDSVALRPDQTGSAVLAVAAGQTAAGPAHEESGIDRSAAATALERQDSGRSGIRARPAPQYLVSLHPHPKKRRISPDKRRIIRYRVRPGDTASGLAVRFRAWTAEVVAMNGPVLRVGERIRIPVVVAAVARDRRAKRAAGAETAQGPRAKKKAGKAGQKNRAQKKRAGKRAAAKSKQQRRAQSRRKRARQEASSRPSRAVVRRVVARTARRHGVDPQLALAVAWQESGWQMHLTSHAGAVGAMQVIPSTGRWMSSLVGRRLNLRDLRDNATAGVVYLKLLLRQARYRRAVAGYYQGLAGVRRHGMYSDTRRYVFNVLAIRKRFERGRYPG